MSCYSKQILELFYNVQNTGRIIKPEAIGRAGSESEGTVIEFSWRVKDGIIEDARFRTFGDVNAIAISSVLTTMMIGKSIDDVLSIKAEDILEHLFDTKPNYLYLTDIALMALGKTYENYEKRNTRTERKQSSISQKLKSDLARIESGEIDVDLENLDLADISSFDDQDEEEYLRNLSSYEKTVEENSLEKSLQMLYSYANKPGTEASVSKGRGRPRKERTPEEIEAELNKEKRGRGRPRKEKTAEEIEAELNKVKRGRGRPRKDGVVAESAPIYATKTVFANDNYKNTYEENSINHVYEETEDDADEFGVDMFSSFTYNKPQPSYNSSRVIIEEENIEDDYDDEDYEEDVEASSYSSLNTYEHTLQPSKGRGRPRKERTPEEIEAELNKEKRGRGRPRKERTPEEIEAELNKEKRGRGRPRKNPELGDDSLDLENKVSRGRGRPRKERTPEEIEAELNKEKRGRGRPRKERTQEEIEAELNKVKRGRGRPKKDTAIVIQSVKPVNVEEKEEDNTLDYQDEVIQSPVEEKTQTNIIEEHVEEKIAEETKEVEIENDITNSFAPANNKFIIGKSSMPYYTNTTTTTYKKVETTTNFYTNIKETYNVISEENKIGGGKDL